MSNYAAGKEWKQEKYQHILEVGFRLFAENGIEQMTMTDIAEASKVGRMPLFRYFPSKTELVIAISTWKWKEYIKWHNSLLPPEITDNLTGAEQLKIYIGSFLELYRNHKDMLRFNYNFNSFLIYQKGTTEQKQPYQKLVDALSLQFHTLYECGRLDGTLNTDISEYTMFSSIFNSKKSSASKKHMYFPLANSIPLLRANAAPPFFFHIYPSYFIRKIL